MSPVEVLNIAFQADPNAMHALMVNRVPCNQFLADDKFVVVEQCAVLDLPHFQVGALGLVNAVLSGLGLPLVASNWGDPDETDHHKLLGFKEYAPVVATDSDQRKEPTCPNIIGNGNEK